MISKFLKEIPIFNVFVMILIISANWMGALYSCKFRALLTNNMYVRHLFGFFTMTFFVVISNSSEIMNLNSILYLAVALYTFFIMMLRTPLMIFLSILFLLLICYLLSMKKNEVIENKLLDAKIKEKSLNIIENMNNIASVIAYTLLIFGFIIYLGQKKIEYKKKFSYIVFLLGKSECINFSPKTNYVSGMLHSFD